MKPKSYYCPACAQWVQATGESSAEVSHYGDGRLVTEVVWIAKCKVCKGQVASMDETPKPVGKNQLCANCGALIFPAGKTVAQCLEDLAAADVATIPGKRKILESRGENLIAHS